MSLVNQDKSGQHSQYGSIDGLKSTGCAKVAHHDDINMDYSVKVNSTCTAEPEARAKREWKRVTRALGHVALYFVLGGVIGAIEGWSWIWSLFFSVVTITTVGYGDIAPKTPAGRLLVSLYIIYGVVLMGWALSAFTDYIAHRLEKLQDKEGWRKSAQLKNPKRKIVIAFAYVVILIFTGVGFLVLDERMSFIDAFYFSVVTLATVGYGDIVIQSTHGQVFFFFYIIFGCIGVGKAVAASIDSFIETRRRKLREFNLRKRMDERDVALADSDLSGNLSQSEFVLYKLCKMELVNPGDLKPIIEQFRQLDTDASGTITKEEAIQLSCTPLSD
mmetsp:Transcript_22477/g.42102  ORF Transcript_22477/g.42102 Transcript_22477/m.42102 type:complete len:331 (+) Transcript_22477:519-1511(+)